jgi:hypothetical protein
MWRKIHLKCVARTHRATRRKIVKDFTNQTQETASTK